MGSCLMGSAIGTTGMQVLYNLLLGCHSPRSRLAAAHITAAARQGPPAADSAGHKLAAAAVPDPARIDRIVVMPFAAA